ncbi:zinc finger CCCH-type antiviral protein 1-like [Salvelinus sp. IW2-2015]|uniref:zinc finger CCCH-type antiviral protein 1-like n=1 Tax=Salvelinus sp. IW2-2015 TaxID=2691554 RepID=UPI0038D37D8C
MTQTNSATRVQRTVWRPKFNSIVSGNGSLSIAQSAPTVIASPPPSAGYTWEFMGEEGVWIEYQTPSCSLESAGIERRYQKNPKGQIRFKAGRYSYTLDFSGMCQTNVGIGTKIIVRRTQCEAQQTSSGGLSPILGFQTSADEGKKIRKGDEERRLLLTIEMQPQT